MSAFLANRILAFMPERRAVLVLMPLRKLDYFEDYAILGPAILHWVVQRNAKTAALITFTSFADYADALRHKARA